MQVNNLDNFFTHHAAVIALQEFFIKFKRSISIIVHFNELTNERFII
jgi:hypothetical protein